MRLISLSICCFRRSPSHWYGYSSFLKFVFIYRAKHRGWQPIDSGRHVVWYFPLATFASHGGHGVGGNRHQHVCVLDNCTELMDAYSAAVLIPMQIFVGDLHGLNTLEHQPAKIAAMEAIWETEQGAPLVLFAIPDEDTRSNLYEVSIPRLASLRLTHDLDGELPGINSFGENRPPVAPLFYGFRIMVGLGA